MIIVILLEKNTKSILAFCFATNTGEFRQEFSEVKSEAFYPASLLFVGSLSLLFLNAADITRNKDSLPFVFSASPAEYFNLFMTIKSDPAAKEFNHRPHRQLHGLTDDESSINFFFRPCCPWLKFFSSVELQV
jgi:hypothetical protein